MLEGLYTWLRTVRHRIATVEDPVFGQLPVPQSVPEQLHYSKLIPTEHLHLALEHLTAPWSHALRIQAGTGWHTTEVVGFARGGSVEPFQSMPRTKDRPVCSSAPGTRTASPTERG